MEKSLRKAALTLLDFPRPERKELEERLARKKFSAESVESPWANSNERLGNNDEKIPRGNRRTVEAVRKGPELIRAT